MSDYIPGDGTAAAKVVAYLHSIPAEAEVGTSTIAEATGLDIQAIIGVGAAVSAGYIVREKIGHRYFYRRGPTKVDQAFIERHPFKEVKLDYVPRAKAIEPNAEEAAAQLMVGQVVGDGFNPGPVETRPETTSLIKRFAEPRPVDKMEEVPPVMKMRDNVLREVAKPREEPVRREKAETMRVPVAATNMRIGIFSDGSLSIERNGITEVYAPEEVVTLVRFLDRMMLKNSSVTP